MVKRESHVPLRFSIRFLFPDAGRVLFGVDGFADDVRATTITSLQGVTMRGIATYWFMRFYSSILDCGRASVIEGMNRQPPPLLFFSCSKLAIIVLFTF